MLAVAILAQRCSVNGTVLRSNSRSAFGTARMLALGLAILPGAALSSTSAAFAAEQAPSEPSEAVFLAQLVLLLLVARLLGEVMQRIGQPAVMGQLLAGIVLGPSMLGGVLAGGRAHDFRCRPRAKGDGGGRVRSRHPDASAAHRNGD
jgi:hypothetical protein